MQKTDLVLLPATYHETRSRALNLMSSNHSSSLVPLENQKEKDEEERDINRNASSLFFLYLGVGWSGYGRHGILFL